MNSTALGRVQIPGKMPKHSVPSQPVSGGYGWRVDLGASEPHWAGWFEGMSRRFVAAPVPCLLLLASIDRLDKDLTLGQMQGEGNSFFWVGNRLFRKDPCKLCSTNA